MSTLKKISPYIVALAFAMAAIVLFLTLQGVKKTAKVNEVNLVNALNDTMTVYRNKYDEEVARITTVQTQQVKDFLAMNLKSNNELQKLQSLVSQYSKQMKQPGSAATIIQTETVFDTVYMETAHKGKVVGRDTILTTLNNKWVSTTWGWKKDSTIFKLQTNDEYGVVLGYEKKTPFADVVSKSPYSKTKSVRTYQVQMPASKKNHLGVSATYGVGADFKPQLIFGVGYTRSIISF